MGVPASPEQIVRYVWMALFGGGALVSTSAISTVVYEVPESIEKVIDVTTDATVTVLLETEYWARNTVRVLGFGLMFLAAWWTYRWCLYYCTMPLRRIVARHAIKHKPKDAFEARYGGRLLGGMQQLPKPTASDDAIHPDRNPPGTWVTFRIRQGRGEQ